MLLPIIAYGDPLLKEQGSSISADYPNLDVLIRNMYETMYNSKGVGLAAHQVGLPIRLFVVDCSPFDEEEPGLSNFKKTFINAEILKEEGEEWLFNEGCLSIPDIREDVSRKPKISLRFFDEKFNEHTEVYEGLAARVIQHELDHTNGILFTDYLSSLRKTTLKRRLRDIMTGNISPGYRMRFPSIKKRKK